MCDAFVGVSCAVVGIILCDCIRPEDVMVVPWAALEAGWLEGR
jgi:hypothetical protein